MEVTEIVSVIVSSVLTGIVSTMGTVKALGVHIAYLRESLDRHERAIERAHQRIDEIDKRRATDVPPG